MPEREYWIAFNHIRGIGAARFRRLLAAFGSLREAWQGDASSLRAAGLDEKSTAAILCGRPTIDPPTLADSIQRRKVDTLTWQDDAYPRRLKELPLPPPVLYLRGSMAEADDIAAAIVGTRRATSYGREAARHFAERFADCHVTVVSGLARGIDAEAHEACLARGGRTIAVLGCGVDVPYPPEHKRLAERIVEQGALLSDYPPGTPPDAANFPPRNRIIAGLSLATVVVEAGETSGALLTAKYAADYGRDVFAVPGSIFAAAQRGGNRLLADGAAPALAPEEVLASMRLGRMEEFQTASRVLPEDPLEARILEQLDQGAAHIDLLRAALGLPIEQVSGTLTMMELKGLVRQTGGMQYASCRLPAERVFE